MGKKGPAPGLKVVRKSVTEALQLGVEAHILAIFCQDHDGFCLLLLIDLHHPAWTQSVARHLRVMGKEWVRARVGKRWAEIAFGEDDAPAEVLQFFSPQLPFEDSDV